MNWLKSFFTYTSTERLGIAVLCCITLVCILIYIALPWFIPQQSFEPDPVLIAAFKNYEQHYAEKNHHTDISTDRNTRLFAFDPNTLDSIGCIQLGLKPVTAKRLLNWRRKGKIFYKKEDLRSLHTLSEEEYLRLEPYIMIGTTRPYDETKHLYKTAPLPDHIELNRTDSATLVRLKGIGPVLAQKIMTKRNALGGFIYHEQLNEIYRFPDSIYQMLCQKLTIDAGAVKKIPVNTAGIEELNAHPYIGEKVARNIILLRNGLGRYENIEQLREVPLMNEEIYRKIAPYFVLE